MQPKRVELEERARACPACGGVSARLVRQDLYLSLFFLPLFPVKRGQPMLECSRCGSLSDPQGRPAREDMDHSTQAPENCPRCHGPLERTWVYCPQCGQKVRAA